MTEACGRCDFEPIIKFGVNDGGGNDTGYNRVEIRADTAEVTMIN